VDLQGRSMKAQMREANRQNARHTVIVGQDEMAESRAMVRAMETGVQENVPFSDLALYFQQPLPV
jgi:histidyl-tRNA synthetase